MKTKSTPVEYKITYELGEGTNNASNPASYTIEDEISLYDATGSSETLCFAGWHTESAFQNKNTSIQSGSKKDYTLYLGWKYNIPVNIETSADTPYALSGNNLTVTSDLDVAYSAKADDILTVKLSVLSSAEISNLKIFMVANAHKICIQTRVGEKPTIYPANKDFRVTKAIINETVDLTGIEACAGQKGKTTADYDYAIFNVKFLDSDGNEVLYTIRWMGFSTWNNFKYQPLLVV